MTGRLPKRLTRHQVVFLTLLILHAAFWLVLALIQPSLRVILICLSSFLAVLAALALVLTVGGSSDLKRWRRWRCADCDTWNAPGEGCTPVDAPCICCGGTRRREVSSVQPECGRCGCTELTFAHAVGSGWVRVNDIVSCRPCASGFPAWMHGPI